MAKGRIWRRVFLVGALALAVGSAFLTWWMTTLSGLPDIGDPFHLADFVDVPVLDDENAYVLYREATRRVGAGAEGFTSHWATAGPDEKRWLERNREALEIWRRGTERPEALYFPSRSITLMTHLTVVQDVRSFVRMAQLEGERLQEIGDLEGAWRWHRAIFRCSRHVGRHGTAIERLVGATLHDAACRQMTRWAGDPAITPPMLREAIDRVVADYATTGLLSDNLKVEYLSYLKTITDPDLVRTALLDENTIGSGQSAWFARDASLFSLGKVFRQEPERSRRVARLVFANLLAACDLVKERRPKVACLLPTAFSTGPKLTIALYTPDDTTPGPSRPLPPDEIRRWFETTLYARHLLPVFITNVIGTVDRERVTQANLVVALAKRLYEIERGQPAESVEELVGPYLKALPDGYQPIK